MAFGIKYKAPYQTVTGEHKEIRFLKDGYTGAVTEWCCGADPIRLAVGDSDTIFGAPVKSKVATIELNIPYQLDILEFLEARQDWKVVLWNVDTEAIEFSGWVEPHDGRKPYSVPPHEVSMKASCGLSHLKKIKYSPTGSTTAKTLIQVLYDCLLLTGHNLPIFATTLTREITLDAGERVLEEIQVDTDRFFTTEGQRLNAYDVLQDLLEKFNAEVFQDGNAWRVRSISDHAQDFNTYHAYVNGAYAYTPPLYFPLTYDVNGTKAKTLQGSEVRALAPTKKYKATATLSPFKGLMPNGNLQLHNGTIFNGYTAVGSVPFNIFTSNNQIATPNYLQINGSSRFIDVFRLETNFWGRQIWKWYQPSKYITSPIIPFSPYQDKVSFTARYFTSAPATGEFLKVLIAVRLISEDGTKTLWLDDAGQWGTVWRGLFFPHSVATVTSSRGGVKVEPGKIEMSIDVGVTNMTYRNRLVPPSYTQMEIRLYQVVTPTAQASAPFIKWFGFKAETEKDNLDDVFELGLQTESKVEDEGESISLMTADWLSGYTGSLLVTDTGAVTGNWKRHNRTEQKSLIWTMLADRLAMLHQPMQVVEGTIKVLPGQPPFSYLNFLRFTDIGDDWYKITRMEWSDRLRQADVTAVQVRYDEPTLTKVAVVMTSGNSGSGRIMIEDGDGQLVMPNEEAGGNVQSGRQSVEDLEEEGTSGIEDIGRFGTSKKVASFILSEAGTIRDVEEIPIDVPPNGLLASYYHGTDLEGPVFATYLQGPLDLSGDVTTVIPGTTELFTDVSVRWQGMVEAPVTGSYTFNMRTDDGVRVYFNDVLEVDDFGFYAATDHEFTVSLTEGMRYPITIEYQQGTGNFEVGLYWEYPDQEEEIVPARYLFPSFQGIAGNVNGSGTENFLPLWLDETTLTDSLLQQTETGLVLGTLTSPTLGLSIESEGYPYVSLLTNKDTADGSGLFFYKGRGDGETPAPAVSGDEIAAFYFNANTATGQAVAAVVTVNVAGTVSGGVAPGQIGFLTTADASGPLTRMILTPEGKLLIGTGTATADLLRVAGDARLDGELTLPGITDATKTKVLFYDPTTKKVSFGAATGAGSLDGSGTANYLPKWTDADTLGDSQVFDNGSFVGIRTATPVTDYEVGIQGNTRVKASTTSTPLLVQNSAGVNNLEVLNTGGMFVRSSSGDAKHVLITTAGSIGFVGVEMWQNTQAQWRFGMSSGLKDFILQRASGGNYSPERTLIVNFNTGELSLPYLATGTTNPTTSGQVHLVTIDGAGKLSRANGLPVYADNTAALAGGLTAGTVYRTSDGTLKIVF
jgi:hypothetical protein